MERLENGRVECSEEAAEQIAHLARQMKSGDVELLYGTQTMAELCEKHFEGERPEFVSFLKLAAEIEHVRLTHDWERKLPDGLVQELVGYRQFYCTDVMNSVDALLKLFRS